MKRPRFVVYQARDGWRWRLVASNGRIIADSGEAYTRKRDAERAVVRTAAIFSTAKNQHGVGFLMADGGLMVG